MSSPGLVKSMLMIGGAQGGNVILSILRVKILALLLGPMGVGLLSIYNNLREAGVIAAGLGLTTSGVREIANAKGEEQALSRVRRVLFVALVIQGALAAAVIWIWRAPLALWLVQDASHATAIGLVGVAIFAFLVSGSQMALLQGMREIADMARATIFGAAVGSVAGVAAVWFLGLDGLIWFILAPPVATLIVASFYTRKLPKPSRGAMSLVEIWQTWSPMVRLGGAFMLGGLLSTAALLLIRGFLTRELGLDAAGQFAASWAISMTYIGFLLNAMVADYFPRLSEVINDRVAANKLMNEQLQLGMAIGGPVLLGLIATAPWFITLLYSSSFDEAGRLLQWQSLGNVFKLASWALGFAIVAAGRSGLFLALQIAFNAVYLGLIWGLFPWLGLEATAVAFMASYMFHLALLYCLVRVIQDFRFQRLSLGLVVMNIGLSGLVMGVAIWMPLVGLVLGLALAVVTGLVGGHVVTSKVSPEGRLAKRLSRFYAALGWPIEGAS